MKAVNLAENGFIPTWLIRTGIRMRLKKKLEIEASKPPHAKESLIQFLKESPIAIATDDANEQHYKVPTAFYQHLLGSCMKYSSCYWPEEVTTLDAAEQASLNQVVERAEISNHMKVLELGCGWGSFSLWAAKKFPESNFTAVSNSSTQADHIRKTALERGIDNLVVITENMLHFEPTTPFDRIVSIEMLEHMRNYQQLFSRISSWLNDDGKLFAHVFSHRTYAYLYEAEDESDWMSNYFFTGGVMPSHDLFSKFDDDLKIEQAWRLNGLHYTRTLEAWLEKLNQNEDVVKQIFVDHYGAADANIWINRWRMFVLACSELFAYDKGEQWGVSHYRFVKQQG